MAGPWVCQQSGECCRMVQAVVLTPEELSKLRTARPEVHLRIVTGGPKGLVAFAAHPCPFLEGDRCSVHAVRPYNCRRYMCGRFDTHEPPDVSRAIPLKVLHSRPLRRQYALMQRKAQRWAYAHGWQKDPRELPRVI